mmetsp:Transcript_10498/g.42445  ORF Transcript_10498/g.42445 Transcript_10498/m.42445 type:complete len:452 (+) Transcript_10498:266-1621(+)
MRTRRRELLHNNSTTTQQTAIIPSKTTRPGGGSEREDRRVGHVVAEGLEELRGRGLVDDAAVVREARGHRGGFFGRRAILRRDGPAGDPRADGEDAGLRRVDDGGELGDAEHAEVGDRAGAALELVRLELAVARSAREVADLGRDRREALGGRVGDDGRDEARGRGDGDRDVDGLVRSRHAVDPRRVGARHISQRERDGLDDDVVHRDFDPELRLERLAELGDLAEVDADRGVRVRHGLPRLGESLGDDLAHRRRRGIGVRCARRRDARDVERGQQRRAERHGGPAWGRRHRRRGRCRYGPGDGRRRRRRRRRRCCVCVRLRRRRGLESSGLFAQRRELDAVAQREEDVALGDAAALARAREARDVDLARVRDEARRRRQQKRVRLGLRRGRLLRRLLRSSSRSRGLGGALGRCCCCRVDREVRELGRVGLRLARDENRLADFDFFADLDQ